MGPLTHPLRSRSHDAGYLGVFLILFPSVLLLFFSPHCLTLSVPLAPCLLSLYLSPISVPVSPSLCTCLPPSISLSSSLSFPASPVHLSLPLSVSSCPPLFVSPLPHPAPSLSIPPVPGLGPVLDKGQVMTGYYRWLQRAGGFVWLQSVATVAVNGKSPGERHVLWVSYVLR